MKHRIGMDSDLFIVRLCTKGLSGFIGFVKTGSIFWKSVYESNPHSECFQNVALREPVAIKSMVF